MSNDLPLRSIDRIERPAIERGLADTHRVRPYIPSGNFIACDPFLLLMEDWFPAGVFGDHPHRGFETVTYLMEGVVDHYDNHGNKGRIHAGDVQWLTAGRGLIHNERPANGEPAHIFQLWVNLSAKDKLVPAYHQELTGNTVPKRVEPGIEVRVFAGASGSTVAQTRNLTPVTLVEVRAEPGVSFEQEIPAGYNGFLLLIQGDAIIGTPAVEFKVGEIAWMSRCDQDSKIRITAGADSARLLIIAGRPLDEPVSARGPFVMNTEAELDEAYAEFRTQRELFGN